MKKIIKTNLAPSAIGPYNQAVVFQNLIFTSGQIPINPKTGEIPSTIVEQAHQSILNCKAILEASNSNLDNVIKTTIFIKNMNDFAVINTIYQSYFKEDLYPARSCVEVSALPKGVLIEIEMIAYIA